MSCCKVILSGVHSDEGGMNGVEGYLEDWKPVSPHLSFVIAPGTFRPALRLMGRAEKRRREGGTRRMARNVLPFAVSPGVFSMQIHDTKAFMGLLSVTGVGFTE